MDNPLLMIAVNALEQLLSLFIVSPIRFTKRVRVSAVNGPRAGPREARVWLYRLPSQFTWHIFICPDNIGFHSSSAGDRVRASRSQNRRSLGSAKFPTRHTAW